MQEAEESRRRNSGRAGSWKFIIGFALVLVLWIILNSYVLASSAWDHYPFILLNLCLACLAAIQAPVIMMSQNRQEAKDRMHAEHDYIEQRSFSRTTRL